jgi:hypothetical protein
MKTKLTLLIAASGWLWAAPGARPAALAAQATVTHAELSDIRPDSKDTSPLADLVASLDVQSVQAVANGGIHLTLTILNAGDTPVDIHNPLDVVSVRLYDDALNPVWLPRVIPRTLINDKSHQSMPLPFAVSSVAITGTPLTQQELRQYTFRLKPSAALTVNLEVTSVQATAAGGAAPQPPVSQWSGVPIDAGRYRVAVDVGLVDADAPNAQRSLQSVPVAVDLTSGNAAAHAGGGKPRQCPRSPLTTWRLIRWS